VVSDISGVHGLLDCLYFEDRDVKSLQNTNYSPDSTVSNSKFHYLFPRTRTITTSSDFVCGGTVTCTHILNVILYPSLILMPVYCRYTFLVNTRILHCREAFLWSFNSEDVDSGDQGQDRLHDGSSSSWVGVHPDARAA